MGFQEGKLTTEVSKKWYGKKSSLLTSIWFRKQ